MATNSEKSGSLQLLGKSPSFSNVRFVCIPETYTTGADVQCSFVVTEDLNISSRDWVGLYKVGWRSSSDYFYYKWSTVPLNYVPGTEVANRVVFPGKIIVLHHNKCLYNVFMIILNMWGTSLTS